jgi:hypothetical protein
MTSTRTVLERNARKALGAVLAHWDRRLGIQTVELEREPGGVPASTWR